MFIERVSYWRAAWFAIVACFCAGCGQIPDGVQPVTGFDAGRYLGTWYEVARLDHSFERGLSQVTATYAARPDGGIDVLPQARSSRPSCALRTVHDTLYQQR